MIYMIYPWQIESWKALQALRERMPHALLIHGPQGIGKLALAEHLAQSLLCESRDRSRVPCGECDGCRWFVAGSHPDFRRVEPESLARRTEAAEDADEPPARAAKPSVEIKVDQIRALDDFLNLRSHREGRRAVLVHPAEAMNANAANALLKGLEEPPGSALFILVSHRPSRLLATVRSRCVPFPVPVPDFAAARSWLEAQGAEDPGRWLAFAAGAPLLALSYVQGPGQSLERALRALEARDMGALGTVDDRERIEVLAEALQKHALDKALASYCGRGRFGETAPSPNGAAWLRYARAMGRNRALARHPLNPRLFAEEMLREMPKE